MTNREWAEKAHEIVLRHFPIRPNLEALFVEHEKEIREECVKMIKDLGSPTAQEMANWLAGYWKHLDND